MLDEVGAKVPTVHGHELSCYGVLYQKHHRICNSCGLRFSCATEAANVGLTKITISPKLLGARQIRVPAVLPAIEGEEPSVSDSREGEIITYLEEMFRKIVWKGETWFSPMESEANDRHFIFCIGERPVPFKLRFCNPADELKTKLADGFWLQPTDDC